MKQNEVTFKVEWKSGSITYLRGINWQEAMRNGKEYRTHLMRSATPMGKSQCSPDVRQYFEGRIAVLMSEKIGLEAENAELRKALNIIRNHQ